MTSNILFKSIKKILFVTIVLSTFFCNNNPTSSDSKEKIRIEVYSDNLDTLLKSDVIEDDTTTFISVDGLGEKKVFVYLYKDGYYTILKRCLNNNTISFNFKEVNKDKICGVVFSDIPESLGVCSNSSIPVMHGGSLYSALNTDSLGRYEVDLPYDTFFIEAGEFIKINDSIVEYAMVSKKIIITSNYNDYWFEFK